MDTDGVEPTLPPYQRGLLPLEDASSQNFVVRTDFHSPMFVQINIIKSLNQLSFVEKSYLSVFVETKTARIETRH